MAKGSTIQFKFQDYSDPTTGVRVTRLSPVEMSCPRNYFYQKCFTNDGRHLLFGCEGEEGHNLWMLDMQTQVARQLTEGAGDNYHGSFVSPDDKYVFYVKNRDNLFRVNLDTLEETLVFRVPEGWKGAGTWVPNSACTKLAAMLIRASDLVSGGTGWDRFRRQFDAKPLQRLLSIDIATGEATVIHEQQCYLGHPMYRPNDDKTMGFCHEGPHDLVDARMWFIDEDGKNLRKVKEHAPGEACMHEFWVPDGSQLIYVSYIKGEQARYIWGADPVTLENRMLMEMPPCAHLMSNENGSLLVGDGAGQLGDVADKEGHAFEPDPYIHVFDMKTRTARKVCEHNSTWKDYKGNHQATHPHPSFTPDDKRVLFSSDVTGKPALYLADLPQ